jgi:hypothetical protein
LKQNFTRTTIIEHKFINWMIMCDIVYVRVINKVYWFFESLLILFIKNTL